MKYYLIAGEASGDLHASRLMNEIMQLDEAAEFRFFGGDCMKSVGGTLVRHYESLAYMGFVQVLLHLKTILRGMSQCKQDILEWNPDALILVDYPGFNLKIAEFIHSHTDIPVIYYIAPKIWAWKESRIKRIRRDVDKMYSILPFEVDYFAHKHNYPIEYVGNPTLDEIDEYCHRHPQNHEDFRHANQLDDRPILALLPGSRKAEVRDNLSRMLDAVHGLENQYQIVISKAPGLSLDFYKDIKGVSSQRFVSDSFSLLQHSEAALVTSGTATLETALFGVPQVVFYYVRGGVLVKIVRHFLLKIPFISLVNLIAGEKIVTELVGSDTEGLRSHCEAIAILPKGKNLETIQRGYKLVRDRLGAPGAPATAARKMLQFLQDRKKNAK